VTIEDNAGNLHLYGDYSTILVRRNTFELHIMGCHNDITVNNSDKGSVMGHFNSVERSGNVKMEIRES
jgi:hypothetical protein